ncbi:uncharacterized protein VNE69_02027 [Vairimorpha necatrix]|uniref:Uncharacterized protein n=1 Tax=Vairimorpha necatrix TaxID=6039 RepID=A0AAX4J986_9MICR
MLLYILLVVSSKFADNNQLISHNDAKKQYKKKKFVNIDFIDKKNEIIETQKKITSKRSCLSLKRTKNIKRPIPKVKIVELSEIESFVVFMKTQYHKNNNSVTEENTLNDEEKLNLFNNFLILWEKQKLELKGTLVNWKFYSKDKYSEYKNCYIRNSKWIKNYSEIIKKYFPQIECELEKAPIDEMSKKLITENLKSISRAMTYFEGLFPKYIHYGLHANLLKALYKLIIERFPLLFDYFNITERFINFYEIIINQHIRKVRDSNDLKIILKKMSNNLTKMLFSYKNYIHGAKEILILLGDLETSN